VDAATQLRGVAERQERQLAALRAGARAPALTWPPAAAGAAGALPHCNDAWRVREVGAPAGPALRARLQR